MFVASVHRRSAFTLTELVVVMGIITILLGMAMPAMSLSMRRADANSTANVIATVHQAQVRNARQVGGSGTVYGFSLIYTKLASAMGKIPTNTYVATAIVPWYVSPKYTIGVYSTLDIGYTTSSNLMQGIGAGLIPGATSLIDDGTNKLYGIDFVDTLVPAISVNFASSSTSRTIRTISLTHSALHVAYEPGTGFVHGITNDINSGLATALTGTNLGILAGNIKSRGLGYTDGSYSGLSLTGPGSGAKATIFVENGAVSSVRITTDGSGYTTGDELTAAFSTGSGFKFLASYSADKNLHLPNNILAGNPNQVEIVLYSMANGAAVNRILLYQNGTYALAGPQ